MDFLPMPHSVRKGEGFFVLRYDTRIVLENTEPSAFLYAQMLQADVQRFTGLKPAILRGTAQPGDVILRADAALVARRGKPDHVADNAAAERNDNVAPAHAVFGKETEDTLPVAERFGVFSGKKVVLQYRKARGLERIGHALCIEREHGRIGIDDRLFRARDGRGNALPAFIEKPRADNNIVFARRRYMDRFHRPSTSSLRRRPSSSRRVSAAA